MTDLLLHLESFVALLGHVRRGRKGAFEHAARELGVDRSVLRRRIRTLDEWLGVSVLHGRGAEKRPTAAGLRLAEGAARVLEAAERLRAEATAAREKIVIACTGTTTTELLPRVLVALEQRPRPVQLVVRRAGGAQCEALVREGTVDLGVVRSEAPPSGFAHQHLTNDRLWFVLPAGHPLASTPKLSLRQMATVPLILYGESSRTRHRVMDRLAPLGGTIRVEVDGRSAALAYVRAGVGATFLSLLPHHAIDAPLRASARDVTGLFGRSRFWVIGRSEAWSDPVVAETVNHLVREAGRRGPDA
jgi:DNA-binding transcriptional LysR family regulator